MLAVSPNHYADPDWTPTPSPFPHTAGRSKTGAATSRAPLLIPPPFSPLLPAARAHPTLPSTSCLTSATGPPPVMTILEPLVPPFLLNDESSHVRRLLQIMALPHPSLPPLSCRTTPPSPLATGAPPPPSNTTTRSRMRHLAIDRRHR
jgi:hypothetical protein